MATRRKTVKKKVAKRKSTKRKKVRKSGAQAASAFSEGLERILGRQLRVTCGYVTAGEFGQPGSFGLFGCQFGLTSHLLDPGSIGTMTGPHSVGTTHSFSGLLAGSSLGRGQALIGTDVFDPNWYAGTLEFSGSVTLPSAVGVGESFCVEAPFRMKGDLIGYDDNPLIGGAGLTEYWRRAIVGRGQAQFWGYRPETHSEYLWINRVVYCFCDQEAGGEICLSPRAFGELLDRIQR